MSNYTFCLKTPQGEYTLFAITLDDLHIEDSILSKEQIKDLISHHEESIRKKQHLILQNQMDIAVLEGRIAKVTKKEIYEVIARQVDQHKAIIFILEDELCKYLHDLSRLQLLIDILQSNPDCKLIAQQKK